jgi:molybdopterin-containing oxidoreductase family iron-sulfur binding subunit
MNTKSQDVNALRARLANAEGREFWRSLDELADTPEFNELLKREFPHGAAEWRDPVSRRCFLPLRRRSPALARGCWSKATKGARLRLRETPTILRRSGRLT